MSMFLCHPVVLFSVSDTLWKCSHNFSDTIPAFPNAKQCCNIEELPMKFCTSIVWLLQVWP